MEAPVQKFSRLTTALDELVTLEAACLSSGDYGAVAEVQRRADPLVTALAELGPSVTDPLARARIGSLILRRQSNLDLIESQLATAGAELHAVQQSTGRVARIAPVYGRAEGHGGVASFHAAG